MAWTAWDGSVAALLPPIREDEVSEENPQDEEEVEAIEN